MWRVGRGKYACIVHLAHAQEMHAAEVRSALAVAGFALQTVDACIDADPVLTVDEAIPRIYGSAAGA